MPLPVYDAEMTVEFSAAEVMAKRLMFLKSLKSWQEILEARGVFISDKVAPVELWRWDGTPRGDYTVTIPIPTHTIVGPRRWAHSIVVAARLVRLREQCSADQTETKRRKHANRLPARPVEGV